MGLFQRDAWGIPVVTNGGTLLGYHSNCYALPEAGVGPVILTNADPGAAMLGPFLRRLLEVVYDGQPQPPRDASTAAPRTKAPAAARRGRFRFPAPTPAHADLA